MATGKIENGDYTIEDENGNLVIKDSTGTAVLTHTDGGDWSYGANVDHGGNDVSNVGALGAERSAIRNTSLWKIQTSEYADSGDGTYATPYSGAVQDAYDAAIAAIPDKSVKWLHIDGVFEDSLDVGATAGEEAIFIDGGHWNSDLRAVSGSSAPVINAQNANTQIDLWVKNVTLKQENTSGGNAAFDTNADEIVVENVSVKNDDNAADAMVFTGSEDVWIYSSDCQVNAGDYALVFDGTTRTFISDYEAINCGYQVTGGGSRFFLSNCLADNATAYGFLLNGNDAPVLSNVRAQSCTDANLFIHQVNRAKVSGNFFTSMSHGVHFGDTNGSVVSGVSNANTGNDVFFDTAASECAYLGYAGGMQNSGINCVSYGVIDGDLTFGANADGCKHYGIVTGTVTNNGTNCSVV